MTIIYGVLDGGEGGVTVMARCRVGWRVTAMGVGAQVVWTALLSALFFKLKITRRMWCVPQDHFCATPPLERALLGA